MRLRPPAGADAPAVFAVILARDLADLGFADFTLADLEEEWARSDFDETADAVVCEDSGGAIVGYAAVRRTHGLAIVDPEHEGRGAGGLLLQWLQRRERELGREHHRQGIVSGHGRSEQLLLGAGYRYERSYSRMVRALQRLPGEVAIEGVELRELDPARDAQAIYRLDAASFADAPDYIPMSFAAFREEHLGPHDLAAELSAVAEREGEPIGFLLARLWREQGAGHVEVLAVSPRHQRQGIGTALLLRAFQRFAHAGLDEVQLGVASSNPRALALYERLGMRPRFRIDTYARPVGGR